MEYPGCGQNILFITTHISLLVKMFFISNLTITGVYNDIPGLFGFVNSILIILFQVLAVTPLRSSPIRHITVIPAWSLRLPGA